MVTQDLKVNGIGRDQGYCYTCNGSRAIVIWESTDLVHWTGPSHPVVSPANAGMTWAPDAIWRPERQQYMVFWTSKLNGTQALHQLRSFTSDFQDILGAGGLRRPRHGQHHRPRPRLGQVLHDQQEWTP